MEEGKDEEEEKEEKEEEEDNDNENCVSLHFAFQCFSLPANDFCRL